MRFALMLEPQQGLSYEEQLAVAHAVEAAGLEGLLRSDHFASFPGASDNPTTDAWAVLAGLARETTRIRLGALVSPVTFRVPGAFAKLVTTVDEMSDGRVEVGLGAGWNALEHARLGIPFPPLAERFDRFEEALAMLHGLWTEPDGWSFEGRFWHVEDALYRPPARRAGRRHPHLIVGGNGKPRGLRAAARYADEYNLSSTSPEEAAAVREALLAACADVGRDPGTLVYSAMTGVLMGETEAEVAQRIADVTAAVSAPGEAADAHEAWLASRRTRWLFGSPEQILERVAAFAAAGVERLALQDFLPRDLAMIDQLGRHLVKAS
ncbi:MAG: TIGR03560 family F420-dependent LLM class oxidoreductase [Candidatus Limnocylindrales bacterium]